MNTRAFESAARSNVRDLVTHYGRVVLGESGAIDSSDTPGFTVTKVAEQSGRYLVQAVDSAGEACSLWGVRDVRVSIVAASIADGEASVGRISDLSEDDGTFTVQFAAIAVSEAFAVTHEDAELPDDAIIFVTFASIRTGVTP